jgi:hypothetical protein
VKFYTCFDKCLQVARAKKRLKGFPNQRVCLRNTNYLIKLLKDLELATLSEVVIHLKGNIFAILFFFKSCLSLLLHLFDDFLFSLFFRSIILFLFFLFILLSIALKCDFLRSLVYSERQELVLEVINLEISAFRFRK